MPLTVTYREPAFDREVTLPLDLLVLAAPSVAAEGSVELSRLLKVPLQRDSFYQEAHVKLRPVDCASEGIFICGAAHYPKSIDETISQAYAAAGRAAAMLAKPAMKAGGVVAEVDQDKCAACLTCVRVCPYNVPVIDPEAKKARIEPATCQGCGVCVSECPVKAITLASLHRRTDPGQGRGAFRGGELRWPTLRIRPWRRRKKRRPPDPSTPISSPR